MALTLGVDSKGQNIYYCPHCERYRFSTHLYIRDDSFKNGVCIDCSRRTGRVARGLTEIKIPRKPYEKMKIEQPEEYHKLQEVKHEKQLKAIENALAVKPRALTKGNLSDYKDVIKRVSAYFDKTALGDDLDVIDRRTAVAPTLIGLANSLGVSVATIRTYRDREFVEAEQMTIKAIITASVQMIAQYAEENIYTHNYQGARFHLSKLVPEVFGEQEGGSSTVINIIDSEQRDRVLKYIAHKNTTKIIEIPPEDITIVES